MVPQYAYFPTRILAATPRQCSTIRCRPLTNCLVRTHASLQQGKPDIPDRQVVLLSGGVESSTLLHYVHARHDEVLGLFFRYGQRAVAQEEAAARAQCAHIGVDDFLIADLTSVGESVRARQKARLHVPLPHRNLVLLSLAVSVAAQEGGRVWIAVCKDDLTWYPSAGTEFLESFACCARTLGVVVETPLIGFEKTEVVRLGLELGVEFGKTWSCMLGRRKPCGRCAQCRARKNAFHECGLDGFT